MGNLGGVVCMTLPATEVHGLTVIEGSLSGISDQVERMSVAM